MVDELRKRKNWQPNAPKYAYDIVRRPLYVRNDGPGFQHNRIWRRLDIDQGALYDHHDFRYLFGWWNERFPEPATFRISFKQFYGFVRLKYIVKTRKNRKINKNLQNFLIRDLLTII